MIRLVSTRGLDAPLEFELFDGKISGPGAARITQIMETCQDGFYPPGQWYWQWNDWRNLGHILAVLTFDGYYELPAALAEQVTKPEIRETEAGVFY